MLKVKVFKRRKSARGSRSRDYKEASDLETLKQENADKDQTIELLQNNADCFEKESHFYKIFVSKMNDALHSLADGLSQAAKEAECTSVKILSKKDNEAVITVTKKKTYEAKATNTNSSELDSSYEMTIMRQKLREVSQNLAVVEAKLEERQEWIVNAKEMMAKRKLLLDSTKELLRASRVEVQMLKKLMGSRIPSDTMDGPMDNQSDEPVS